MQENKLPIRKHCMVFCITLTLTGF